MLIEKEQEPVWQEQGHKPLADMAYSRSLQRRDFLFFSSLCKKTFPRYFVYNYKGKWKIC